MGIKLQQNTTAKLKAYSTVPKEPRHTPLGQHDSSFSKYINHSFLLKGKNIYPHSLGKSATIGLLVNVSRFCCMLIGMRYPAAVLFPLAALLLPSTPAPSAGDNWPQKHTVRAPMGQLNVSVITSGNNKVHTCDDQFRSVGRRSITKMLHK